MLAGGATKLGTGCQELGSGATRSRNLFQLLVRAVCLGATTTAQRGTWCTRGAGGGGGKRDKWGRIYV